MPPAPVLLDIPDRFETERLIIRVPRAGDGKAINEGILESVNELAPWMPWVHPPPTEEQSEARCRECRARFELREDMQLNLYLKDTGQFVGGSGLHRPRWEVPSFEIGYWIRTSYVGRGLMTEAVRGITAFGFETLKARRIQIQCAATNIRSEAVMIRAGFKKEGLLRNDRRGIDGQVENTLMYALTDEEWSGKSVPGAQ